EMQIVCLSIGGIQRVAIGAGKDVNAVYRRIAGCLNRGARSAINVSGLADEPRRARASGARVCDNGRESAGVSGLISAGGSVILTLLPKEAADRVAVCLATGNCSFQVEGERPCRPVRYQRTAARDRHEDNPLECPCRDQLVRQSAQP